VSVLPDLAQQVLSLACGDFPPLGQSQERYRDHVERVAPQSDRPILAGAIARYPETRGELLAIIEIVPADATAREIAQRIVAELRHG
jgi:hypothetical protein